MTVSYLYEYRKLRYETLVSNQASLDLSLVERIYGEYSEGTKIIRNFRNDVLSQTLIGQELISLYYQWSPTIVKAMEEDEEFKEQVKKLTDTILLLLNERLDVSN